MVVFSGMIAGMNKHIGDHIKVVLFDHDDTLVGTIDAKWKQHKHIAKTYYNFDLSDETIREHWGKPLRELLCLLYETDDPEKALAHTVTVHESFPKELFVATIPTLKHLKDEGKLVGVITATSRFSVEHDLRLHNVPAEYIDYLQSSDETIYHKPNPKVFEPTLKWLKQQGVKPNEVVYIGDGLHDMKAALGAGFSFLGVETGLVTAKQFKAAGAQSLASIGELFPS